MSKITNTPETATYAELLQRRLVEMSPKDLQVLLTRVCEHLWGDGITDEAWSADTPQEVAGDLGELCPDKLAMHYGVTLLATEPCDECAADIPQVDGGGLVNRHHNPSCSLYDPGQE